MLCTPALAMAIRLLPSDTSEGKSGSQSGGTVDELLRDEGTMSDKTYRLVISDDVSTYAYVHGTTNIIGYVVRELDLNPEFTYEVSLTETSALAGENVRTVLAITADGGTVVTLLKAKVSWERKAAKAVSAAADESLPEETPAENETAEQDQQEPAFA